jgi:hypothetical protein
MEKSLFASFSSEKEESYLLPLLETPINPFRLDNVLALVHALFVTNPYTPHLHIRFEGRAPRNLAERVANILEAVRGAIAAHARAVPSTVPIIRIVWTYLNHTARRLDALTRRVAAGTAAIRPRARRAPDPAEPAKPRPAPQHPPLPRQFGWLCRLSPNVAAFASQLRHVLASDEVATLLIEAPQAARLLRPLCTMFGIRPGLDLPAVLFPRRPKRAPRPRTPRPPKEPRAPRPRARPRPIQIYPTRTQQEREQLDQELAEWHAARPEREKARALAAPDRPPPCFRWRTNNSDR